MKTSIKLAFFSVLLLFFSACEDSTFIQASDANTSFGGIVVDGYISGATVCLDLNNNDSCDTSEPSTTSDESGTFSFTDKDFTNYDFISVIAKGGIDTATQKEFQGELKSIIDTNSLAQNDSLVINPLTDLVAISFLQTTSRSAQALAESTQEVADVFTLNKEDVLSDPMQNVKLFAKVQEVQHLKDLIETSAAKTYVDTTKDLTKEVKKALVTQIKESENGALNLQRVLDTVEIELNIVIPENERTFILAQVEEIDRALNIFVADENIDTSNLGRLQLALEHELEDAYIQLENADDTNESAIEVVDINITYAFITQSIFSKTEAILDEQACLERNGYMMISDTPFPPEVDEDDRKSDSVNGVSIESKFLYNADVNSTEVKLYYTALTSEQLYSNTIVFTDEYTFVYDQARLANENKTIYIGMPKDENELYSCYRLELNTTVASEIKDSIVKVFRYSDI